MDFSPIKEMYLFEGQKDTTFNEIRTWKGVFFSVLSASEIYLGTLQDAVKVLQGVSPSDTPKDAIRGAQQGTARALSDMLTQISNLQKHVLGGMETFRDSQGPFAELNRMSSIGFKSQDETSRSIVKDHKELETKALKALKKYERRVTERDTLHNPRSGTFSWNDLCCVSYRRNTISQKVDAARLYFALQSRREITQREVVVQQTRTLKIEFLKEERDKLEALFSTISVVWDKIGKIVPYQIRRTEQKGILPKDSNTLAKLGWEVRLQLYKFPEYQVDQNNIKLGKEVQEIIENITQNSTHDAVAKRETYLRGQEHNRSGNALSSKKRKEDDSVLTTSGISSFEDQGSNKRPVTSYGQSGIKTEDSNLNGVASQDVGMSKEAILTLKEAFFSGEVHPDGDDVQRAFARKRFTLGKRVTTYVLMKPAAAAPTVSASTATASSAGSSVSALVGIVQRVNSASLIMMKQITDLRWQKLNRSGNALSSKKQQKTDLPSKELRSSFFSGEVHPDGDDVQRAFARKRSTLGKRETTYVLMKPTKTAPSASDTTLAVATASASTATASSSGASASALVGMAKTIDSASLIKNSSLMKRITPSGDTKVDRRPDSVDGTRSDSEKELDSNSQKGHLQAGDKSRLSLTSKTCKKEARSSFFSGEVQPDGDDVQRAFARKRSTLGKRETTYVLIKPAEAPSASSTTLAVATASASTATASSSGASVSALVRMAKTIDSASLIKNSSLVKQSTPSVDTQTSRRTDSANGTRSDPKQELDFNSQKGRNNFLADDKSRSSLTSKTSKKKETNKEQKDGFFRRIFSRSKRSKPASSIRTTKTAMMSIKSRQKENANEISLREGMKIKMTKPVNIDGMAYGYKCTKLGLKKYGYFPANAVVSLEARGNDK